MRLLQAPHTGNGIVLRLSQTVLLQLFCLSRKFTANANNYNASPYDIAQMHQGSLKLERVAAQSMSKAGSLRRRTQGGVYKPVEDHRHCSVCDIGKPYDAMPVVSLSLTTQPLPAGRAQLRRSRLRAAGPVQYQELLEVRWIHLKLVATQAISYTVWRA